MHKISTLLLLMIIFVSTQAQDIHFTQYYASPMTLNPAMTGLYSGNIRFIGNYKNQWSSVSDGPYSTFAGSFDMRFDKGFMPHDNFGLGVQFFNDRAGDGDLSDMLFMFTSSYIKVLNRFRTQYLSMGAQLGISSRSIDYTKLRFGSQWDGDSYDGSLSTGESFTLNSYSMAELGAGIMWYYINKDRKSFNVGVAMHHINQPNVSFDANTQEKLNSRITAHGGAVLPIGEDMDFIPSVLFMKQVPHTEINPGVGIKYHMDKETSISLQVWDRLGREYRGRFFNDAVNIGARVDYKTIGMGISYDINLSDLKRGSNSRGSFELSIVYTDKARNKYKTLNCPKF